MAWKTLRDALENAAASGFDIGEAGVAAPALRRKNAEAEAPASVHKGSPPAVIQDANRCMTTAFPNELPRSAVVIHLVVDNSGGRREEGAGVRRLRCNAPGERLRELGWVVHSAASRACVCEAAS